MTNWAFCAITLHLIASQTLSIKWLDKFVSYALDLQELDALAKLKIMNMSKFKENNLIQTSPNLMQHSRLKWMKRRIKRHLHMAKNKTWATECKRKLNKKMEIAKFISMGSKEAVYNIQMLLITNNRIT